MSKHTNACMHGDSQREQVAHRLNSGTDCTATQGSSPITSKFPVPIFPSSMFWCWLHFCSAVFLKIFSRRHFHHTPLDFAHLSIAVQFLEPLHISFQEKQRPGLFGCPSARPVRPVEIFKYIQVYSRYFKRIFREYVQYVGFILDVMGRTACLPAH
jgi:hypothetical protein